MSESLVKSSRPKVTESRRFLSQVDLENGGQIGPKSMSRCTSFWKPFFDSFLKLKWCKSDPAGMRFDIAGVGRTALFHKIPSSVFYLILESKMVPKWSQNRANIGPSWLLNLVQQMMSKIIRFGFDSGAILAPKIEPSWPDEL